MRGIGCGACEGRLAPSMAWPFLTGLRRLENIRGGASFARSDVVSSSSGFKPFPWLLPPLGSQDHLDAWCPSGFCKTFRRTRALGGQQCGNDIANGGQAPIAPPTRGTADRTTESLHCVSSGKLARYNNSSIERPRTPGCDSGSVSCTCCQETDVCPSREPGPDANDCGGLAPPEARSVR